MPHAETIETPSAVAADEIKPVRRAILSVTDKTGIADFARALEKAGVELVSTGGTAKLLRDYPASLLSISSPRNKKTHQPGENGSPVVGAFICSVLSEFGPDAAACL